jgi:hypothetical protein
LAYAADPDAAGSKILASLNATPEAVRALIDKSSQPG